MRTRPVRVFSVFTLLTLALLASVPAYGEMTTVLVTAKTDGSAPPYGGDYPAVSSDGRCVAFMSGSDELPPGAGNGYAQFYRRDVLTGTTVRVSVSSSGAMANYNPYNWYQPEISADGSRVEFSTMATNVVPDAANWTDVFMRDVNAGTTSWVSVNSSGVQGNRNSDFPAISANGRYVAFSSTSFNLAPGTEDNIENVFLRDTTGGTTVRASIAESGAQPKADCSYPSVNNNGDVVAFVSRANNLVANDANTCDDVFVRYLSTNHTICVSVDTIGTPANSTSSMPVLTPNGRYVAFVSAASNILPGATAGFFQVYVRDLQNGTVTRASVATDGTIGARGGTSPSICDDGRYVAFTSQSANLVAGDTDGANDYFVRDMVAQTTTRVSVAYDGAQSNGDVWRAAMSGEGQCFAFASEATNLIPGGSSGRQIFLRKAASNPPYVPSDVASAAKAIAGLTVLSASDSARLNVVDPATSGVDLRDAVRIMRKAAGLDANP